ncbi:MAG: type II toxin-antitoxin system PemK/MazF family toxin [Candidatus Omnitrophica bacterium]|nr:type II toxin-antitoxin system PemK/MazF family toxin [Candidatus Omnitrophota bacterium]
MNRGDLILIKYPFSNLQGTKVRPALVISSDRLNKHNRDALFILITSNTSNQQAVDYLIDQQHPDFQKTGLKRPSLIKVDKIVCLMKSLAKRKLGTISRPIQSDIDNILKDVLGL